MSASMLCLALAIAFIGASLRIIDNFCNSLPASEPDPTTASVKSSKLNPYSINKSFSSPDARNSLLTASSYRLSITVFLSSQRSGLAFLRSAAVATIAFNDFGFNKGDTRSSTLSVKPVNTWASPN